MAGLVIGYRRDSQQRWMASWHRPELPTAQPTIIFALTSCTFRHSVCSAGVEPDNQFYGMLMKAAGAHGDLEPVLGLQAEMEREGLHPCAVSCLVLTGPRLLLAAEADEPRQMLTWRSLTWLT